MHHVFYGWVQIGMSGWFTNYSFHCQPVDYSDNPTAMRVSALALELLILQLYDYVISGTQISLSCTPGKHDIGRCHMENEFEPGLTLKPRK